MKKGIMILMAVLFIAVLASCKKDYTCKCSWEYEGIDGMETSEVEFVIEDVSKGDAEEGCTYSAVAPGIEVNCELL
jgi:hypothetical protein